MGLANVGIDVCSGLDENEYNREMYKKKKKKKKKITPFSSKLDIYRIIKVKEKVVGPFTLHKKLS